MISVCCLTDCKAKIQLFYCISLFGLFDCCHLNFCQLLISKTLYQKTNLRNGFSTPNLIILDVSHAQMVQFLGFQIFTTGVRRGSDAILNFEKAYRGTIRDNSVIESRHIQAPFLKFSPFYNFFHLIMADFLLLLGYKRATLQLVIAS